MVTNRHSFVNTLRIAAGICAVVGLGGCIDQTTAPALTGPSGFGTSITLTASPNVLPRDGVSTSQIAVTVRRDNAPVANQHVKLSTSAGQVQAADQVTNTQGVATFTVVAPSPNDNVTTVLVTATPVGGTDYTNVQPASALLSVFGPAPPTADFTFTPTAPVGLQAIVFDGSASKAGFGSTIYQYTWDLGNGVVTEPSGSAFYKYDQGYPVAVVDTAYVVTLTVTDTEGRTGFIRKTVTVKP
jgi:hypothetical protein